MTFNDPRVAEQVSVHHHFVDGKAIDVKRAVPKNESYSDVVNSDTSFVTNKIFVGGLPIPLHEKELSGVFSKFGQILDLVIIQDKNTRQSRGFGFVEFADHLAVERVMQNYYHVQVQGKWVECKKALPRANYPECMSKLMRGATLMRFENSEEEEMVRKPPVNLPDTPPMRQVEDAESLLPRHFPGQRETFRGRPVLGVRQNGFGANCEISVEEDVQGLPIDMDEGFRPDNNNKENVYRGNSIVHVDLGHPDDRVYFGQQDKMGIKDPRKRNFVEGKQKPRRPALTLGMNLKAERDNRSFNVF